MSAWLRKVQMIQTEMLDEYVRICEKHDLRYYLDGGTLLGAARHEGFIPWDDDIDFIMPRPDYDRFFALAQHELREAYLLESWRLDPNDPYPFMRVRKRNTVMENKWSRRFSLQSTGIWIDIFPLDEQPGARSLAQRLDRILIQWLSTALYHYRDQDLSKNSLRARLFLRGARMLPFRSYCRLRDRIASRHEGKGLPFLMSTYGSYSPEKETFPREWFEPHTTLMFEGRVCRVPGQYDKVLRQVYGDYMRLPPPEKRVTHGPVRLSFDLSGPDEPLE